MSGATPPSDDPMRLMREAYAQGLERWSLAVEEIVGSDDFAAASGQLLSLYAQQQQAMRAASRVAAESIQMPTTEDLAEVAQLVINVERKVDELTDHDAASATRFAAIESQLAEVATAVQAIPSRLTAVEETIERAASVSRAVSEQLARIEGAIAEAGKAPRAKEPTAKVRAARADAPARSSVRAPAVGKPPAPKATRTRRTSPTDG